MNSLWIFNQIAHDEAIMYLHRNEGDTMKALREAMDSQFITNDKMRLMIIDQILEIKGE